MLTKEEEWVLKEKYLGLVTPDFEVDKARLARGEPVAYVIGWQPFLGLKIYLDSHPLIPPYSAKAPQGRRPLIPRPETEWWTEQLLIKSGHRMSTFGFLDLCAGSGAIGCVALKYLPEAEVYFGEIDPAHEATIIKNIRENGLDESRARVCIGDLFAPFGDTRFDIITCNPPYVPQGRALPQSVTNHEPALALYSGADGLDLMRHIASELPARLTPDGAAWIECDGSSADAASGLFEHAGMRCKIRTDQYEVPRVVEVSLP